MKRNFVTNYSRIKFAVKNSKSLKIVGRHMIEKKRNFALKNFSI